MLLIRIITFLYLMGIVYCCWELYNTPGAFEEIKEVFESTLIPFTPVIASTYILFFIVLSPFYLVKEWIIKLKG